MTLTCPLCKNYFSIECLPLVYTPCGHTFCKDCIEYSFRQFSQFQCDRCSKCSNIGDSENHFVYNRILIEQGLSSRPAGLGNPKENLLRRLFRSKQQVSGNTHADFNPGSSFQRPVNIDPQNLHSKKIIQNKFFRVREKSPSLIQTSISKQRSLSPLVKGVCGTSRSRPGTPIRNKYFKTPNSPRVSHTMPSPNQQAHSTMQGFDSNLGTPSMSKMSKYVKNPNYKSNASRRLSRSKSVSKLRVQQRNLSISKGREQDNLEYLLKHSRSPTVKQNSLYQGKDLFISQPTYYFINIL